MAASRFCRDSLRIARENLRMDAVAIFAAIATFAILIGLIYAIDRI
jgi:hypothetical protein